MLGDVEETIYIVNDEEDVNEDGEGSVETVRKQSEMLFVRGVCPPLTSLRERNTQNNDGYEVDQRLTGMYR